MSTPEMKQLNVLIKVETDRRLDFLVMLYQDELGDKIGKKDIVDLLINKDFEEKESKAILEEQEGKAANLGEQLETRLEQKDKHKQIDEHIKKKLQSSFALELVEDFKKQSAR